MFNIESLASTLASILGLLWRLLVPFVSAYVKTLSMRLSDVPLWSLAVSIILLVQILTLPMTLRRIASDFKISCASLSYKVKKLFSPRKKEFDASAFAASLQSKVNQKSA